MEPKCGDKRFVHFACENHQGNIAGFRIGHAQAGDELTLLAQCLEHAR